MKQLKLAEAKRLIDLANKSKTEYEDFHQISNLVFSVIVADGIEFVDGKLPYKLVYIREHLYEYPMVNNAVTDCYYDLLSVTFEDGNLVIPVPLLRKDFLCSMIQFFEVQERAHPMFRDDDEVIEPTMTKLAIVEEFLSICDKLQIDKDELETIVRHVFKPSKSKDLLKWINKSKKWIEKRKSVIESAFEEFVNKNQSK